MLASCTGVCASLESVQIAGSWNFDQETAWNVWALKLALIVCVCLLVRGNVGAHFITKERSC